jgi:plasmid stability protein
MPLLQVRDFPPDLYDRLRRKADADHRSIAQQTVALLEEALDSPPSNRARRAEVLAAIKAAPAPALSLDPVEFIRRDRDSR